MLIGSADSEEVLDVRVAVDVVEFNEVGIFGHADRVDDNTCRLELLGCRRPRRASLVHVRVAVRHQNHDLVGSLTSSVTRRELHKSRTQLRIQQPPPLLI